MESNAAAEPHEDAAPTESAVRHAQSLERDQQAPLAAAECNEQAQELYARADASTNVAEARQLMQQVYDRCRLPDYLFNLAQLDRELGHCSSAVQNYRAFVTQDPLNSRGGDARAAIAQLEPSCPNGAPRTPLTPPIETARPAARRSDVLAWSLVGVGGATALAALYFAVESIRDGQAESRFFAHSRALPADERSAWDPSLQDRYRRDHALLALSGIGSAALLTTGLLMLSRHAPEPHGQTRFLGGQVSVSFLAHGGFAALSETF